MFTAYVITYNTVDYPGRYVLRRHHGIDGRLIADGVPLAVADDLQSVRRALPAAVVPMPMEANHDPVIVEWWM